MDDLISEFLTETNESLEELDLDLVNLEQNPNDADLIGKIFRLVHTIKGTCGFLGLPRLEKVAHHGENVLGRFRSKDLEVTPEYVTLIFECIDCIKMLVADLGETGSEPEGDDSALIEKLDAVYEGRDGGEAAGGAGDSSSAAAAPEEKKAEAPTEGGGNITQEELDALEAAFQAAEGPAEFSVQEPAPSPVSEPEPVKAEEPAAAEKDGEAAAKSAEKSVSTQSLRVNVDVLENLMTMVSELVLTRNQLIQIQRQQADADFSAPLQRLNQVVSELQDGVMKTRMQPIGNAWSKLPRIIRDLSIELGKKIELEMIGQDTELDRQVLDLIKDPLTHMVRNSGDHGIEVPEARKAAGKPETGKITLKAYHEGGHIIIEIIDDGKGLSSEKIKAKVLENGLATQEELDDMSENQLHKYIFHAGLSTAEKVTSVSGRGVGMDVVRTNIEKIGGSIDLKSVEGSGSTFTIKIPLTLAIVSALIVESSRERFAIPQLSVRELVMASEHGENRIETIKGAPVLRLRDRLLPLISLSDLLKLQAVQETDTAPEPKEEDEDEVAADNDAPEKAREQKKDKVQESSRHQYIVVTQVGASDFGIIVDKVYDTEEIVVKPVAQILRGIELFSGNTILGDGSVIMILDPNGIAKNIGQIDAADQAEAAVQEDSFHARRGRKTSLLLFAAGNKTPKAVPLSLVARLENIELSQIERSGGQMMVQYREQLMPLTPFDSSIQIGETGEKPVLVFSDKGRSMGLIVDEIIDIKEEYMEVQHDGGQSGLLGSAIIDGKATDIVDVGYYLQSSNKNWFKQHGDDPYGHATNGKANGHSKKRVLLVDDSPFFRNMLTPLLSVAGYDVISLESPHEALDMCDKGAEFDVIISDIEMPDMDGFEFAQKVKEDTSWKSVPMLALTSHATQQDIDRGMSVGFSNYIAKFDRDTLLNTLSKTLAEQQQNSAPSAKTGDAA
ncbi:MAG: chemotaxis protein CheW [Alphaproteobacteria bacterium]